MLHSYRADIIFPPFCQADEQTLLCLVRKKCTLQRVLQRVLQHVL